MRFPPPTFSTLRKSLYFFGQLQLFNLILPREYYAVTPTVPTTYYFIVGPASVFIFIDSLSIFHFAIYNSRNFKFLISSSMITPTPAYSFLTSSYLLLHLFQPFLGLAPLFLSRNSPIFSLQLSFSHSQFLFHIRLLSLTPPDAAIPLPLGYSNKEIV